MSYEKYVFPLVVVAAVVGAYVFLRGSGSVPIAVNVPNPASSGVQGISTVPAVGTVNNVEPVDYDADGIPLDPSAYSVLSQPQNPRPMLSGDDTTPLYLSFNLGPALDLSKQAAPIDPATDQPSNQNIFMDGGGATLLSSSRARQLAAQTGWLQRAATNIESYLDMEQNATSPLPTLTSYVPSGSLN